MPAPIRRAGDTFFRPRNERDAVVLAEHPVCVLLDDVIQPGPLDEERQPALREQVVQVGRDVGDGGLRRELGQLETMFEGAYSVVFQHCRSRLVFVEQRGVKLVDPGPHPHVGQRPETRTRIAHRDDVAFHRFDLLGGCNVLVPGLGHFFDTRFFQNVHVVEQNAGIGVQGHRVLCAVHVAHFVQARKPVFGVERVLAGDAIFQRLQTARPCSGRDGQVIDQHHIPAATGTERRQLGGRVFVERRLLNFDVDVGMLLAPHLIEFTGIILDALRGFRFTAITSDPPEGEGHLLVFLSHHRSGHSGHNGQSQYKNQYFYTS